MGFGGDSWSRSFVIAQAVIVVAILSVALLARFVVDISPAPPTREAPTAGFALAPRSDIAPVACPGGLSGGYPLAGRDLGADCAALLTAKAELAGGAALNWSADEPITEWDGISLGGDPLRVTAIYLTSKGLSGVIPMSLAELSGLRGLHLYGNDLSGSIPAELGRLGNLRTLDVGGNRLAGGIPAELSRLELLMWLDVGDNRLVGPLPAALADMENMEWLVIAGNELVGSVTETLEGMSKLAYLDLSDTLLTGCIPAALREVDGFLGGLPICADR